MDETMLKEQFRRDIIMLLHKYCSVYYIFSGWS